MAIRYEDVESKAIMSVAIMHLVIVAIITTVPWLIFGFDPMITGLIGLCAAAGFFMMWREDFRFEVPENSTAVLTWDDQQYTVSPGIWWKAMGADVKEDNRFTSERKITSGKDSIPCKNGARLEVAYGIQWSIIDAAVHNAVGAAATDKRLRSHAERYFGEIARNGGQGVPEGEQILLNKDTIAREFEEHFENDGSFILDLARRFGVRAELGYFDSPLDYDDATKKTLVERYRRAQILADARDTQSAGVSNLETSLKLLAAIDGQSDVSIRDQAFKLDVAVTGLDPEAAKALTELLRANPALLAALAQRNNSAGGGRGNP